MSAAIPPVIDVVDVDLLGRYAVELTFEGGEVRIIALEPYLARPMCEPLREDHELFRLVQQTPRPEPSSGRTVRTSLPAPRTRSRNPRFLRGPGSPVLADDAVPAARDGR